MGARANRRGVHRYSIRAPLRWEGVESRDRGEGLTENISTRGVYFLGDRPMAVGQPIRLTMTLERRSVSATPLAAAGFRPRGAATPARSSVHPRAPSGCTARVAPAPSP